MSLEPLKYLSEMKLTELREKVHQNHDRYTTSDFWDLTKDNGWSIELDIKTDLDQLKDLDPTVGGDFEVKNSMLVWRTLRGLSPALATEERIWARLAHVECLEFSRNRWLKGSSQEAIAANINRHFFAGTWTSVRDDHAIARLWWNAYVAQLAMPDDIERALATMLSKADIRSNLVERSRTSSRPLLAAAILRAMISDHRITQTEDGFRAFMKTVNKFGGGELFEVMPSGTIDHFIKECAERAQAATTQ
jgi:uncharacterized protein DUF6339